MGNHWENDDSLVVVSRTMPRQKPGHSKQDYHTPPEFLEAVKTILGITSFWRDCAASPENAVCPRYWTEKDNALVMPWATPEGEWNWCNPPFAKIAPWVQRAYWHSFNGSGRTAVLVPAGVGTEWFRDHVMRKAQVLFLSPRLVFPNCPPNPKTGKVDPYPKDLMLLLYAKDIYRGYGQWEWKKDRRRRTPVPSCGDPHDGPCNAACGY